MKDLIYYEKGFMSADDVKAITEYARAYDSEFTEFGNNEKEFTVHKHSSIKLNNPEIADLIVSYARKVHDHVVNFYPGPFKEFVEERTHIARFETGSGMHAHFDSSRPNDIATLIYINDDYEGGEIYFPDYDIEIKPGPGDLLTFPDNPSFVHGVKPIISGTRYTTPRWFTRIV